jgi:catechol 2,3-dioxygenase-like lactoylglutathione lyase family enzyme
MAGIKRFLCITVAVKDQEEALQWYTEKLGFRKHTDMPETEVEGRALPGPGMRFLSVSPPEQPDLQVILASWLPDLIGKNPTAILSTDDCQGTYEELKQRGVTFSEAPQPRPFGVQAIFQDLYGNRYALLQPGKGRSLSASPE